MFSWKGSIYYWEGGTHVFASHMNKFNHYVIEDFVAFKLQVGFDAFMISMPNVYGLVDSVATDIFNVWISH